MPLHQHTTEFAARNLLLFVVLGLRRQGETFRALVNRYAAPEAPRVASAPGDDALIAAALGLAALFARLDAHLHAAAAQTPPPAATPPPPQPQRGMLR